MSNIMELLESQLSGKVLDQLSRQVGAQNNTQTQTAVNGALTAILNGLSKNVQSPQGAQALLSALDKDHDGSLFNDVAGFLSGNAQAANPSMFNGAGILKHVLGGNQSGIVDVIAKASGLDAGKAGQLLITLAPMIMGMLGKMKNQNNLDAGTLSDMIKTTTQQVNKTQPSSNLLTKILDRDGDGQIIDDIAQTGFKAVLGRLFGKK